MGNSLGPQSETAEIAVPDLVNFADGLSEEEAIVLALWNNAAYRALLVDLEVARADIILASQLQNPDIITMFPLSAKQWEFTLYLPLDAFVLRPQRMNAAELEAKRITQRLVQDGLNVISQARLAHIDLAQAETQLSISRRNAERLRAVAKIGEARLEAGAFSELDVSALRLSALVAEEQLIRHTHDAELAREQLRFVLGMVPEELTVTPQQVTSPEHPTLDIEVLTSQAGASRPDLRALDLAISAAGTRARLARFDYLNISGLLPDINAKGDKGFEAGPGLRMSVPIFHQNQGNIARANAQVMQLQKQRDALRQDIDLQVQRAHIQWQRAQDQFRIWHERVVPQARNAVTAARKGLEENDAVLLLVLETSRQLLDAEQGELLAAADLRRAVVELERSVGHRLFVPENNPDQPPPAPEPKPIAVEVQP